MRITVILLMVALVGSGLALALSEGAWSAVLVAALSGGALAAAGWRIVRQRQPARHASSRALFNTLLRLGEALDQVSVAALRQRGGWDRALFADVLAEAEALTPPFQAALADYLALPGARQAEALDALLAVDRLLSTTTAWTRLFPPRQTDEAMFVLSLLHTLNTKVETAVQWLQESGV